MYCCITIHPFLLIIMIVERLKEKVLAGGLISREEALELASVANKITLYKAAGEIRDKKCGKKFDTCSIVNARSGRCSENCKWCAQSAAFKTHIQKYDLIDEETCLELAWANSEYGVDKFSFVTSGRALSDKHLEEICRYAIKIKETARIHLCASMGLLSRSQLLKLKEAGINRYHCNLETSPRFFPYLCSTHTVADKISTIKAAQEAGMEVCSGGIIGMGETVEDRIDLALTLRDLGIKSIPLNILNPIPGTLLENAQPLTDEEVLTAIALFRFINADAYLRFAGGRLQIKHIETKAIEAGINAAIMGDLLTTIGSKVKEDIEKITSMGFTL